VVDEVVAGFAGGDEVGGVDELAFVFKAVAFGEGCVWRGWRFQCRRRKRKSFSLGDMEECCVF
jgi:hypothetical protein